MAPSFTFFLFALGILCWVVLPVCVVVAAAVCHRFEPDDPLWVRQCRAADPSDPAGSPCWVPFGEHCPRHDLPRRPGASPDETGWERFVA